MPPEEEKRVSEGLAVLTNEVKNLSGKVEDLGKEVYAYRGILGDHSNFIEFFGDKLDREEEARKFANGKSEAALKEITATAASALREASEKTEAALKTITNREEKVSGRRWAIGLTVFSSLFAAFLFWTGKILHSVIIHLAK